MVNIKPRSYIPWKHSILRLLPYLPLPIPLPIVRSVWISMLTLDQGSWSLKHPRGIRLEKQLQDYVDVVVYWIDFHMWGVAHACAGSRAHAGGICACSWDGAHRGLRVHVRGWGARGGHMCMCGFSHPHCIMACTLSAHSNKKVSNDWSKLFLF